ncbi:ATP synthase F1 subunit epsilon [Algicella marina]|uniref:ATP synthase epsilon chain n=1 Tax=Algicella marina TaxID=2683284 RepID=A0A6P1T6M2_9RHOB|nr:ATP synthase F1 subunit epsilon [Algicella marina]QHQ36212.1 ATP synthase F1 subunit epsilon [Algicella marina]
MHLDIVTPERQLLSAEVSMVQIPGMEGDMAVMGNHAPTVTTLRPGILTVTSGEGTQEYVVTGGFAEISPEGASVLAEQAVLRSEFSPEMLSGLVTEARESLEIADPSAKAAVAQRINDFETLSARVS